MKTIVSVYFLIHILFSFAQNPDIETLVNQVAMDEVPNNFAYYFLVPKSMEQPEVYDYSPKNYRIRELKKSYNDFPLHPVYRNIEATSQWKTYNLKHVRYPSNKYINPTAPPRTKTVIFVKYNITKPKYDSVIKAKEPNTLIVKKKLFWSKNRIWKNKKFYQELVTAWHNDLKENLEEQVYFQFSTPLFTKDKKYAIISIFKRRRCKGNGFTALYRKENGTWKKLMEYNQLVSTSFTTHSRCEAISISY